MFHGPARIGRERFRTEIQVGSGHRLLSDESSALGGSGAGPVPCEHLA